MLDGEGDAQQAERGEPAPPVPIRFGAGRHLHRGEPDGDRQIVELAVIAGDQDRHRIEEEEQSDPVAIFAPQDGGDREIGRRQHGDDDKAEGRLRLRAQRRQPARGSQDQEPDRAVIVARRLGIDVAAARDDVADDPVGLEIEIVAERGNRKRATIPAAIRAMKSGPSARSVLCAPVPAPSLDTRRRYRRAAGMSRSSRPPEPLRSSSRT